MNWIMIMVEKMRIAISWIFFILLGILFLFSNNLLEEKAPLTSGFVFAAGVFLVGIASFGRLWCTLCIVGYKNDRLIMVGPYSLSRNPLYFFSLLGGIGIGLISESVMIPLIIAIAFAIYYPSVIRREEARLKKKHHDEFLRYCENVPRFFPKFSNFIEPVEYLVKPKLIRKHIVYALWFVWMIGIIELIEKFHDLKILPTFFNLY